VGFEGVMIRLHQYMLTVYQERELVPQFSECTLAAKSTLTIPLCDAFRPLQRDALASSTTATQRVSSSSRPSRRRSKGMPHITPKPSAGSWIPSGQAVHPIFGMIGAHSSSATPAQSVVR